MQYATIFKSHIEKLREQRKCIEEGPVTATMLTTATAIGNGFKSDDKTWKVLYRAAFPKAKSKAKSK